MMRKIVKETRVPNCCVPVSGHETLARASPYLRTTCAKRRRMALHGRWATLPQASQ